MRVSAHAKLNLTLHVLAREASGYHQIETIFCKLELADDVVVNLTGSTLELEVAADASGAVPDIGPAEQNLAVRAAAAFAAHTNTTRGIHIHLTKRIPHGAGLGGASTDAAAVLTALNALHDAPLGDAALLALGAGLGSDVPFFLSGASMALAWGRGHRIARLPALPQRPVLLGMPPQRVPTADAYAALSHHRGHTWSAPPAVRDLRIESWNDAARIAHNDFEEVVFLRLPQQGRLRAALEAAGGVPARLTGTGSAVFAIFADDAAVERGCQLITAEFKDVSCIVTRTAGEETERGREEDVRS